MLRGARRQQINRDDSSIEVLAAAPPEAMARAAQEQFGVAFVSATVGMAIVRLDGTFLGVNPALCEISGSSEIELVTGGWPALIHPDDLTPLLAYVGRAVAGNRERYDEEVRYIHADGRMLCGLATVTLVTDDQDKPLFLFAQIRDVTDRKHAEEEVQDLRVQSIRDPLTGLFNRRYMEESLNRELHRAARNERSLGIIMIDVDRFKLVNDTFGHAAGDEMLQALGQFLGSGIREEDIACRYGGEEFMLILPEASLEVTYFRAEQLWKEVKTLEVRHHAQVLEAPTFSLGVAVYPDHGSTPQDMMRAVDAALYRAKAEGRDRLAVAEPVS